MASDRRFPTHHPLLRNLQQVVTILSQQIKRMGNVRNVLNVTVLEA
jgi:hypothetical protein